MIKIGVIGAGHLGKIHIKCIKEIKEYALIGFYDSNEDTKAIVASEFGIKSFDTMDELIKAVDVIDIITPTISHFPVASASIKQFKHIFIEKPLCSNLTEGKKLISLAGEANVKVQVGHVERFNPAFIAAKPYIKEPMFIETHRLAEFNPRGTDVPVVLDLMIHDIDILLNIVKANVKRVSASGVSVISKTPDIANARIEFDNGCVANLTASRISLKKMRKFRIFQPEAYIAIDFFKKKSEIINIEELKANEKEGPFDIIINTAPEENRKRIKIFNPETNEINAIKMELESFYKAVKNDKDPEVSIQDSYKALELAYKIIEKSNNKL
ncbi:MAG: Gfo/Idh/MocA family oxidoreductase [Bacteroidales bacterium]|nr:Gfo/Idh/MocA family oxidoreductase [Bacteroidales bacterium]